MGVFVCKKCGLVKPHEGPCANCEPISIRVEEIHQWSRHYDTLQWTATGIPLASAAAVAFKVLVPEPSQPTYRTLCWLGLSLTLLSAFAVLSFRSLRRQVHAYLPEDHRRLVRNLSWLPQWLVNYGVHLAALGFWFYHLEIAHDLTGCGWQLALVVYFFTASLALAALWGHHIARIERRK